MRRMVALLLALTLVCCMAGFAAADGEPMGQPAGEPAYRLVEEQAPVEIGAEPVPLAASPHTCCILHFVLMLCALAVTVYYVHDRKASQMRIFELRRASVD